MTMKTKRPDERGEAPMSDDHDEYELGDDEIEITIDPRQEDLDALGISPEEFESALMTTLDAYDQAVDAADPDAITPLEEAEITLGGKVYHLREVADVAITGGLDGLGLDEGEPE
jgi:hypothetical protein